MIRENITLTVLFADIANSTKFYETLGNKAAQKLIGNCLSILSKVSVSHHGTVVKTIGDEIMCTFPSVDDAVEAAIDMNRDLASMPDAGIAGIFPPNIYVGLQQGTVIRGDNDVFGDTVSVAAQMVELAKQRQIITTKETIESLKPELKSSTRLIDKTTIKGKAGEVSIYEIMWEKRDETIIMHVPLDSITVESRIELRLMDQIIVVDQNRPSVTLGRQQHNDLVIEDICVSRTHARIEYRRGKFLLIDQSTNGTYAQSKGEKTINLKRDEAPLLGNGAISLGREMDQSSYEKTPLIHFEIKP